MHLAGQRVADWPSWKSFGPSWEILGIPAWRPPGGALRCCATRRKQRNYVDPSPAKSDAAVLPNSCRTPSQLGSSPSSVKRKARRKSRQSCRPANSVKPPPNGFSLKKSSKTAVSCARPARQYAYAMVNWYRSVRSGGTRPREDHSTTWRVFAAGAAIFCGNRGFWDLKSADNLPSETVQSNMPQVVRGGRVRGRVRDPRARHVLLLEECRKTNRFFPFTGV